MTKDDDDAPASNESAVAGMTKDQVKKAFAARLKAAMLKKGWNQSQLAEQAGLFSVKKMGRDNISIYMNARSLPGPTNLYAISRALGIPMTELLPEALDEYPPVADGGVESIEIKSVPNKPGWMHISINDTIPQDRVIKIMQILDGCDS